VKIIYDVDKRDKTLKERNVDFADFPRLFEGWYFEQPDNRRDYGEPRTIIAGYLSRRLIIAVYTVRGSVYRVISMRKGNEREKAKFKRIKAKEVIHNTRR
jgi:uncharacterized protein